MTRTRWAVVGPTFSNETVAQLAARERESRGYGRHEAMPWPALDDALLRFVLDTYSLEGVEAWLENWLAADDKKRHMMRVGLVSA